MSCTYAFKKPLLSENQQSSITHTVDINRYFHCLAFPSPLKHLHCSFEANQPAGLLLQ